MQFDCVNSDIKDIMLNSIDSQKTKLRNYEPL